jgi:hypothetical protein
VLGKLLHERADLRRRRFLTRRCQPAFLGHHSNLPMS